jgi:hypothetical protein
VRFFIVNYCTLKTDIRKKRTSKDSHQITLLKSQIIFRTVFSVGIICFMDCAQISYYSFIHSFILVCNEVLHRNHVLEESASNDVPPLKPV